MILNRHLPNFHEISSLIYQRVLKVIAVLSVGLCTFSPSSVAAFEGFFFSMSYCKAFCLVIPYTTKVRKNYDIPNI